MSSMKIDIKVEGTHVLIQVTEGLKSFVLQLEAARAKEFGGAVYRAGLNAEEKLKAELLALDSGFLIRAGAPFTLSDNPRILAEAVKEACWNRDFRRWMPSIKSKAIVGTPGIKGGTPW